MFSLSWVRCFPKDLEKPDPRKGKETTQCRGHQRFSFAKAWVSHAPLHHHPCSPASGLREGKDSLPQSRFSSLRENGRYQRPPPSISTIDPLRDHLRSPLTSTKSKTDCVSSPFCFWWEYVNERFCASCKRTKKLLFCSDQRERIATCPAHSKDGVWVRLPLPPPLIFTQVKTSEKHRHGQALLAMSVFFFFGKTFIAPTSAYTPTSDTPRGSCRSIF